MGTVTALTPAGERANAQPRSRVLVVDDDRAIRVTVSDALGEGYDCTTAASADEAVVILSAGAAIDLIFCDVRMGEMSGIAFVEYCRTQGVLIPIIMMTGVIDVDVILDALRAGATDYLQKPFDFEEVGKAVGRANDGKRRAHLGREEARELYLNGVAKALALSLGYKDNETNGHAARVVHYSVRLGEELGLDPERMLALKLGARLHDIGKIAVPDGVLKKPAKLNEQEWAQMREHPLKGELMARELGLPEPAARVIGQHHEWWNGKGYPRGITGTEIDLPARIFSVIDAYDAITSDRCYRRAQSHEQAVAELRRFAGEQFDPEVVAAFARVPAEEWEAVRTNCRDEVLIFPAAANF